MAPLSAVIEISPGPVPFPPGVRAHGARWVLLAVVAIAALAAVAGPAEGCDLGCAFEGEADGCQLLCVSCAGCSLFALSSLDQSAIPAHPALPSSINDLLTPLALFPRDILHVPRFS